MSKYVVVRGDKSLPFESKEALIQYFVAKDIKIRRENVVGKKNGESYIPSVFWDLALNKNDQKAVMPVLLRESGEFYHFMEVPKEPRTTMVFDADGRAVDIRRWLPEFRVAVKEWFAPKKSDPRDNYSTFMGSKPRFRKAYRIGKGTRQRRAMSELIEAEDILRFASAVPVQMTRGLTGCDEDWHPRNCSKSWKDQSKARKSWQKNSARGGQPSARTLNKQFQEEPFQDVEDELAKEEALELVS